MYIGAQSLEPFRHSWPSDDELSWFAVRQPGVLRFLEAQLGDDDDALAVALTTTWRIFTAYHDAEGMHAPRLGHGILVRSVYAILREIAGPVTYDGLAVRQPDLCSFVYRVLADPPFPLTRDQEHTLAQCLWAIIYALDETVCGRPIP